MSRDRRRPAIALAAGLPAVRPPANGWFDAGLPVARLPAAGLPAAGLPAAGLPAAGLVGVRRLTVRLVAAGLLAAAPGVIAVACVAGSWAVGAEAFAAEPSSVAGGGITLRSVQVRLPASGRVFGGQDADPVNGNCLTCHSAGMVLNQPVLSPTAWQAEVEKMRSQFKAPVKEADVPAIVAYLVGHQKEANAAASFVGAPHSVVGQPGGGPAPR